MREGSRGEPIFHMNQKADLVRRNPADLDSPYGYSGDEGPIGDGLSTEKKQASVYEKAIDEALEIEKEKEIDEALEIEKEKATDELKETLRRTRLKIPKQRFTEESPGRASSALTDVRAIIDEMPETPADALLRQKKESPKKATPEIDQRMSVGDALADVHGILASEKLDIGPDKVRSDEQIALASDISTLKTRHRRVVDAPTRISNDMAKDREARKARIKAKDEELDTLDKESRAEQAAQKLKLRETFKRVNGLIQLFGEELLQKKYNLSVSMIEGLSEYEINKLDTRLKAIQKEENIEMDRLYQQAEQDRKRKVTKEESQTSFVKQKEEPTQPRASIIVDELDEMNREAEPEKERPGFFRKLFGGPELTQEQRKIQEENKRYDEWASAVPRMSKKEMIRNAQTAFEINLEDNSTENLKKISALLSAGTVRGEIFKMLYNRFRLVETAEKKPTPERVEALKTPAVVNVYETRPTPEQMERQESLRLRVQNQTERMRELIRQLEKRLTSQQKQQLQGVLMNRGLAERAQNLGNVLEATEQAINLLNSFERALDTKASQPQEKKGFFAKLFGR